MRERFTLKKKTDPVTVLKLFKFLSQTEQSKAPMQRFLTIVFFIYQMYP